MNHGNDWFVYLLRCVDNSLYCGVTKDLKKRVHAHGLGKGAKYTRSRTPVRLLANSPAMTKSKALKLEQRIKRTPAKSKLTELQNGGASPGMKKQTILHEIQTELHSLVKLIQQLAESVAAIVAAMEKLTQPDLPQEQEKVKRAPTRKKVIIKDGVVAKIKRIPATQIVYDLIQKSQQGMDTAALMKTTGFDQRKVHNIIFRLKKQGLVKRVGRGVHKKA